jgi:hypothetical protein
MRRHGTVTGHFLPVFCRDAGAKWTFIRLKEFLSAFLRHKISPIGIFLADISAARVQW